MLKQINGIVLTALLSGLFAFPAQAHEWRERRHHRHKHYYDHRDYSHHYPPHGKIVVSLPGKHVSVIIGGQRYYHCDGVYYRRDRYRYVVVPHPRKLLLLLRMMIIEKTMSMPSILPLIFLIPGADIRRSPSKEPQTALSVPRENFIQRLNS